jgi:hypothetical protein
MDYDQINLRAFIGTVEELKEMLFKYGEDKNVRLAIFNGLNGESNDGKHSYQGIAKERDAKDKIFADFVDKIGEFSPQSAESKLAAEYNKMAARVKQLEAEAVEKDKLIAKLKIDDRNNNYFPGH